MKKRNLILGVIKDYDFFIIKPFLVSLEETGFAEDVVLFASGIDEKTKAAILSYHVTLIPFHPQFPYLDIVEETKASITERFSDSNANEMIIHVYRFIIWYLFLTDKHLDYERIMLTDVRDVFFQKDPFDFSFCNDICCFVEDENILIKDCCFNSAWIKNVYGDDLLQEIGHYPPSCCGIIIGTLPAIRYYLENMIDQLVRIKTHHYGDDTAIHNYLVYKRRLEGIHLYKNEAGPVIALMNKKRDTILINKQGRLINRNNQTVNIVHQYDRYPEVVEKFFRKYRSLTKDRKKNRMTFLPGSRVRNDLRNGRIPLQVQIHYSRCDKAMEVCTEELIEDNGYNLKTFSHTPADMSLNLSARWQKEGLIPAGQMIDSLEKYHFYHEYFMVIKFYNLKDRLLGYKCDITTPLQKKNRSYHLTDLCLTFWIYPDMTIHDLDCDKYRAAVNAGLFSIELQAKATETMERVKFEIAQRKFLDVYLH